MSFLIQVGIGTKIGMKINVIISCYSLCRIEKTTVKTMYSTATDDNTYVIVSMTSVTRLVKLYVQDARMVMSDLEIIFLECE